MDSRNRLATEASPYLQQHAANPVDWWPWGEEAFAEARRRDVPVIISVGYSACHWCHVMAHESFEDPEVARVLNDGFVAVKVDREERPDVDALYMTAVQLATGSGGWPMTVVATPDGRPFWGGTYLPKDAFLRLLGRVVELWGSQRAQLEKDADTLSEALRRHASPVGTSTTAGTTGTSTGTTSRPAMTAAGELAGAELTWADALSAAAHDVLAHHDTEWGGSVGAPKFPEPARLEALARYAWRFGDDAALAALCRTLDAMSSGGIYDHLGGGFARYSTDRYWLVPHFEKMLYDNALLVAVYTHAWQLTGAPRYRQVVEETVAYLLSPPIRLPEGAWAASEDADSEGQEGRFYAWSYDELVATAGAEAAAWYGATPRGNWEGANILWRPGAGTLERPPEIEEARRKLAAKRAERPRPGLDDKVLTEWNAMAVSSLAYAGRAFAKPEWVSAAAETAGVLMAKLRRPDGRWLRSWRPGSPAAPKHLAVAADYAWLVEAFTRLGEATGQASWTDAAGETASGLAERFWDRDHRGFFTSGDDAEELVARQKDFYDGAVPSANSTASFALARLGELTGEHRWEELATSTLELASPALARAPGAFCWLARAADYLASPRRQVVVSSCEPELVRPVWERYLPDTVLAWCEPFASPLWEGRDGPAAAGQAFVCEGYQCRLPLNSPGELARLLGAR